ncbi:hypothetical protein QBC46DRAFT_398880 [Diplogelasinospora grovesii]|uniref:Zn(2)-C6 fungal-type domain-containing protein n=1 Tax=Diplogelasinospora grovesii TaxID=303347 RepID=A0AAN6MXS2_9PEZI|nr:hypothetical protein QBC46DRAFT_398880 [Diplogelasinospora grovesii]
MGGNRNHEATSSRDSTHTAELRSSCEPCHVSKPKCSREKPVCARCSKTGMSCTYRQSSAQAGRARLHPHRAPDKVRSLTHHSGHTASRSSGPARRKRGPSSQSDR